MANCYILVFGNLVVFAKACLVCLLCGLLCLFGCFHCLFLIFLNDSSWKSLSLSVLLGSTMSRHALLVKIASVREVVLGAPLRLVLKNLASKTVDPDMDQLLALVHRPQESFFLIPQVKLSFSMEFLLCWVDNMFRIYHFKLEVILQYRYFSHQLSLCFQFKRVYVLFVYLKEILFLIYAFIFNWASF